MYSNAPDLSSARQLFDEMPEKDSASYNAIISIYSKFGMRRLSLSLFQKMVRDGVCSDEFTFVTILNDFVKVGQIFGGMQLHSLIVKGRFCSDHFTCNALLSLYSKCGFVGSAAKLLDEIGGRDVVSWTSMIAGLMASGCERDTFEAFGWMRMSEVVPNTFTFGSLVGSCASTSSLEMGKQFHALVLKYGLEGGVVVGSAMVDMYSKSGEMDNTMRIFRSLRENGEEKCVKLQEEVRQLEDEKITWMQKEELTGLKRDNAYSNMPFDDFLELVLSISELQHPNIVELVGYCSEFQQRLLVYNYICKRTLHDILHSSNILKRKLSWNTRIQVAIGAARALEYLHEGCIPPIVHQNFEPANVLLDDELSVRVSECGLASLITFDSVTQLSGRLRAILSYEAPEINEFGSRTDRSDVYSFGVVMLELLTGRKPYDSSLPRAEQHLVRWASSQLYDINALSKIVDPSIDGGYPEKSLSRFADIISRCILREPEFRPPISQVIQDLSRILVEDVDAKNGGTLVD